MMTFHQSCILLGLTALVSGLLVPYILKRIDERRMREKQLGEMAAARQAKVIEAQSKLLNDLTAMLWRWRYLCIRLTYYAGEGLKTEYEASWRKYHQRIWPLFSGIRNEISRSRRLASESMYQALLAFYGNMVEIDQRLTQLHRSTALDRTISYLDLNHELYNDFTTGIEELLDDLASELHLKAYGNPMEVSDGNGQIVRAPEERVRRGEHRRAAGYSPGGDHAGGIPGEGAVEHGVPRRKKSATLDERVH